VVADIAKLSVGREAYHTRELATDHERTCPVTVSPRDGGTAPAQPPLAAGRSIRGRVPGHVRGPRPHNGRAARPPHGRNAVPGFDVVLRPTKSVSILYGLGDAATGRAVLAAHHTGLAEAVGYLDEHLGARRGHGGVQHVSGQGLLAVGFDHRTSREGDPLLHTHWWWQVARGCRREGTVSHSAPLGLRRSAGEDPEPGVDPGRHELLLGGAGWRLAVERLVFAEVDQGPKGDGGQRGHVPHRQPAGLEQPGEDPDREVIAALDQLLMHQPGQVGEVGAVPLEEPEQVGLGGQACERELGELGEGGSFVVEVEHVQEILQRPELRGVARYRGGEDVLLGGEVPVQPAASGGQAGGLLDRADRGAAIAPLAEQGHRRIQDALPGWLAGVHLPIVPSLTAM
jgi:hypothetical protein